MLQQCSAVHLFCCYVIGVVYVPPVLVSTKSEGMSIARLYAERMKLLARLGAALRRSCLKGRDHVVSAWMYPADVYIQTHQVRSVLCVAGKWSHSVPIIGQGYPHAHAHSPHRAGTQAPQSPLVDRQPMQTPSQLPCSRHPSAVEASARPPDDQAYICYFRYTREEVEDIGYSISQ